MDEREFESMLERLFKQGLSADAEQFRDALLGRCLESLKSDANEFDDADLEFLAAAGNIEALGGTFHDWSN